MPKRALTMHAMLQISFGAPPAIIGDWIEDKDLEMFLSRREAAMLAKPDGLSVQDSTDLRWYLEALWTLIWAGRFIANLPLQEPVGDVLASFLPNLQRGEDGQRFLAAFRLRPCQEVFPMLDLYFRAHWYARDGQLSGQDTAPFVLDIITERRKALEWVIDSTISDWDECPQDT